MDPLDPLWRQQADPLADAVIEALGDKLQAREEEDIRRGRELREQHGNQPEGQEDKYRARDNDGVERP